MLSPRLTNCPECANIPSLIKKIDCKLAELGNNLYNNISYMLNKSVPSSDILQLIGYRRILMYKYYNPNYVHTYSVQMIASRVIRLTSGCVSKCNEPERCLEEPCDITIVPNPTTTTSTTIQPTTTTTSSSSTSTTTSTSTSTSSTTTSTSTTATPTTTTTSSSSTSTTTTTTTETPITIECVTYLTSDGNVYAYDPITNLSIDIFNDSNTYFNVLNTDTKLWTQQSGGYIGEYNLTFNPGPVATYDRLINLGGPNILPIFAIDNVTLIAFNSGTEAIDELDITTTTATSTFIGSVETGYDVLDGVLTTSGKLILVAINNSDINNIRTRIYQYDYSTWTLEITIDVTNELPTFLISSITVRSYIIGISQYQGEIYLFSRVISCSTVPGVTSRVYNLDLLTNTLVYTGNDTGFTCANSASSQLICNTVDINPNIIPTTTTTTTGPITTTTTTTLAPTGFNTIYTHFEAI